jgi:nitrite reductase (NADH) small subunit
MRRSRELRADPWQSEVEAPAAPSGFCPLVPPAPEAPGWARVAALDDLPQGEGRAVRVGGREIALFRTGPCELRALHGRCPHAGGPLADGIVAGGAVTCPLHGWRVDLTSGEATSPAGNREVVPTHCVELRGSEVWVDLP